MKSAENITSYYFLWVSIFCGMGPKKETCVFLSASVPLQHCKDVGKIGLLMAANGTLGQTIQA